ncbi:MAG: cupin domain-containing protein [Rhodothermales bacterium]
MRTIDRRTFLLTSLATAPLVSCASAPRASLAQNRQAGTLVRVGQDRTGHPRNVFGGLHIDAKVLPDDTTGNLYIIEHTDEAKGGPPRHVHHTQDEWFYVLEGAYRIEVGERRFDVGPGDSVFAPREVPHVWAHVSEGEGRLIIAFQPAGQMESFLGGLAELGSAPSPEVMAPLFASHGMTMLGPPLPLTS